MSFRALRRRLTPAWLSNERRRHWRDVVYRRLGIQRSYRPFALVRSPHWMIRSPFPMVVAEGLLRNPQFTFMQIGAFDGIVDDDLQKIIVEHQVRGLLVEPQPEAVARLRQTYEGQPHVTILQAAIDDRQGTRDLFCVRGEASVLASFDRGHLLRHHVPDDQIVAQPVACHTIESALRSAGFERVDLIQIDTEGYDYQIIRSIDFPKLRPSVVRFEHHHLSRRDADACIELLAGHGYRFLSEQHDVIACLAEDSPLLAEAGERTPPDATPATRRHVA